MNYRFKRRSFLATLGGAVAFQTMLENLEAAEAGASSPPRLLAAAWPVGTIRYHYLPLGGSRDFTMSRILMPFEALGLREDLVILYGLSHRGLASNGGGPEGGTVMMMTGADSPGCRENGGEQDDSVAGGPSFDQIFLKHAPNLQRPGKGYANAIGDARVDSQETSTQCLSYSHVTRQIESSRPGGPITENTPLLPKLHPIDLYTELFSDFTPGVDDPSQMVMDLRLKKSVLDGSLRQLARLGQLAPASERTKVEIHTEAVRKLEQQLSDLLAEPRDCELPPAPDATIQGKSGSQFYYGNPQAVEPDAELVERIGKLHLATIRAAFQCDLIRVATFAWTPSQPNMAIENLDPNDPEVHYMHHPLSHRTGSASFYSGEPPDPGASDAYVYEAMVRANIWYFQKYADVFAEWKTATDGFGNPLLDHTVIPLMTDVADGAHAREPLAALILGGKALGLQGGQFLDFQSNRRPHNDLWLTIAQAFFPDSPNVLDAMPGEVFFRDGVAPIDGLWQRPA
jgi:hypothetical protein